ncbi:uncharacterized protein LOC127805760 [Diospyros lotus]|uniref:uncharacterized protein LOC127805760 n=1 Tax=Diospyros lotus TaxID=55363 RepID=UPI002253F84E|nr:uncharacterized protein LOC127805760 [Diospyros lotus]
MHAIKGGWVGPTFALAKCNDSEGKKSRIRRSKEQRKAMVESFIKKYQTQNNGKFPSLNLTHKEVGGSFYTVREIVREVIQENKVLGPAKLTPEEQGRDLISEQYPLGPILIGSETDLSLLNITQTSPNIHQDGTEELVLNSSVHCHEPERGKFDEGHVINGSSQTIEKNEHHGKTIFTETRAKEILEVEENVAELQASNAKVTQIAADIIVETFPLSGSTIAYGLDEKSSDQGERTDTWVERELEKVEARNNQSFVDSKMMGFIGNSSDFGNDKAESNNGGLSLEKTFVLVDEKAVGADLGAQMLENSNDSTTKEGTIHNTNDEIKPEAKDASTAAIKALDAKDGIHASTPDGTVTSSSPEQSSSVEAIVSESKPDIQHGGNSLRESNPTLDRMNLESWNVESERSVEPETNPLMAFFRSFIAAFVKFWSE